METGPQLKVSSDRLVKPGIEPGTPGLQDKRFIHYTTAAPTSFKYLNIERPWNDQTKFLKHGACANKIVPDQLPPREAV